MSDSNIDQQEFSDNFRPMPVLELLDGNHHFIIPSYQRGYRWEDKQVEDLLEDIKQFANDENPENKHYYLQPLVVKKTKEGDWEVLDGQQRLTTMLLILKYMVENGLTPLERKKFDGKLYDIKYKSRPQLDFDNPCPADNIDSYYLSEAKSKIEAWFEHQVDIGYDVVSAFKQCLFFSGKKQVRFIWYAISGKKDEEKDEIRSIQVFNRLNKGKISLTSSELIKALLIMNYDHLAKKEDISLTLLSEQLSMEWNEMERRFQDDKFWHFISNDSPDCQTRIDVLFDFVTKRPVDHPTDNDYSYRKFQNLYDYGVSKANKDSAEKIILDKVWQEQEIFSMKEAWKKTIEIFNRMVSWYEDPMYYHYIGYLVALGDKPLVIFKDLETEKAKARIEHPDKEWTNDDTRKAFHRMIMQKFKYQNRILKKEEVDGLEYTSDLTRRTLLLFNIESYRLTGTQRFDFDRYKRDYWDLEHIDSQNTASLQENQDKERWLKNVIFILKIEAKNSARKSNAEALIERCEKMLEEYTSTGRIKEKTFDGIDRDVNKYFSYEEGVDSSIEAVDLFAKNKDNISNLTLLDSATNRGYQDAPFPYKRYCVVNLDRKGEKFMPMCTRNVFLKYYTDTDQESSYLDAMRWNSADRRCYLQKIHEVIDPIFDSVLETQTSEDSHDESTE